MSDLPELTFKEDLEMLGGLKPQQVLFIAEVAAGANLGDAAEAAGYARSAGYRLMKMPEIVEELLKRRASKLRRLEVTEERVLQEIAKMAFLDPRQLFYDDGSPKPIHELDEFTAACIAGIDIEEEFEGRGMGRRPVGAVRKIKFIDKLRANELLGRYLKLWTDRVEVSGPEALAERLRQGRLNAGKELIEGDGGQSTTGK